MIFLFFKNYFCDQHIKTIQNIKKTINFKKNIFFLWKTVPTSPCLTARNFEGNNRVHAKSQKKKEKKRKGVHASQNYGIP